MTKSYYGVLIFTLILILTWNSSCTRLISKIQYKKMFRKVYLLPDTITITKLEKSGDSLNIFLKLSIPPKFLPFHAIISFQPSLYNSDIICKLNTSTLQGQHVMDDAIMIDYKNGAEVHYGARVLYQECIDKDFKINVIVTQDNGKFGWKQLKDLYVKDFRKYCDSIK